MNLYHVQFKNFEGVAVFAENELEAHALVEIYIAHNCNENEDFSISDAVDGSHLSRVEFYQLQHALALNSPGIGWYDACDGWKVVPLWKDYMLSSGS